MTQEILDRFKSHSVSETQKNLMAECRAKYFSIVSFIIEALPPGRDQSMVLTKLEEASFFTIAAIARGKE